MAAGCGQAGCRAVRRETLPSGGHEGQARSSHDRQRKVQPVHSLDQQQGRLTTVKPSAP